MATAAGNPAATGLPSFDVGESDDFVEYWLHLEWAAPSETDDCAMRSALQARCVLCLDFVRQWTDRYIWQRDPFVLIPCPANGVDGVPVPCLYGRTYWGENIDDEWFIVWLLLQVTKRWPGTVVSVVDNDGQFLLIEACEEIPRWIKPDNAAHRVQLASGSVHLVPVSVVESITAPAAVAAVRAPESLSPTLASVAVQKVIMDRLEQFEPIPPLLSRPQLIHRARLYLPADIFRILSKHPQLVAPAVEAFFARDPIDMRLCNKMAAFPCTTRRFGLVAFSRCLYAQLQGQRCKTPRCFGEMPPEAAPERKPFELGMKLACGFEILLQTGRRNIKRAGPLAPASFSGSAPPILAAECMAALERYGYFEQCGSSQRSEAEHFAVAVLRRMEDDEEVLLEDGARFGGGAYDTHEECETGEEGRRRSQSKASASLVHSRSVRSASMMEEVLSQQLPSKSADVPKEATRSGDSTASNEADRARHERVAALGVGQLLTAAAADQNEDEEEDDDDWLTVSESEVDEMLRNLSGGSGGDKSTRSEGFVGADTNSSQQGPPTSTEQAEMEALTARMTAFLEQSSGLDGVRGVSQNNRTVDDSDGEGDDGDIIGGTTNSEHRVSKQAQDGAEVSLEMDKILKLMEGLMAGSLPDGAGPESDSISQAEESENEEGDEFYDGPVGDSDSNDENDVIDKNDKTREEDKEALEYMERMDTELRLDAGGLGDPSLGSRLGESFVRRPAAVPSEGGAARAAACAAGNGDDGETDCERAGEVDLDWNLVQNLVESFNSQEGNAGPTTNLLSMLGSTLPENVRRR